ncbi:MAG: aspartate aminotransferase [Legionellaceae bacterium]|nr:aspartate aminotransferase [Legionellaceae bacterium]
MTQPLSQRIQSIKPSATLSLNAKAKALKAEGKDIISLSVGEPDFNTPENIRAAAIKAINEGNNHYTPVDGTPAIKDAIIKKFKRDNKLDYQADQVMATTGGKQAIFNLLIAMLNPGDEVIIPAPYWVSYPDMVVLNGGEPVIITADAKQHFKITAEQLDRAITDKTKLFMLNSPSNPTGMAYSNDELKAIADVLLKHPHVYLMSDDVYEHILWDKANTQHILNLCPELYERTIIVNAASKSYAMTGWRLGFAAGPKDIIGAMKKAQGQSTSNPCSIAQAAVVEALSGDQSCLDEFCRIFRERHDAVLKRLQAMDGVEVGPADGAFYLFPNVAKVIQKLGLKDDAELSALLLEKAGVAVVPGSAFGLADHLRLSYALDLETLNKAMDCIEKVI